MPIYIEQTNSIAPNYVKVKGKIYKKTGNNITTFGTYITGSVTGYDVLENADFQNTRKKDNTTRLRPVYARVSTETFTPGTINTDTNTFNLTVITKQSNHPLFNQGSSLSLSVSGAHAVPLNLIRGKKYVFRQTDSSNTGHKARLTSDAAGLIPVVTPDSAYTGTAGTNGSLTFIIPLTCQDVLFLSSEGAQFMGITVNVDQFVESIPSTFNSYSILSAVDFFTPLSAI